MRERERERVFESLLSDPIRNYEFVECTIRADNIENCFCPTSIYYYNFLLPLYITSKHCSLQLHLYTTTFYSIYILHLSIKSIDLLHLLITFIYLIHLSNTFLSINLSTRYNHFALMYPIR